LTTFIRPGRKARQLAVDIQIEKRLIAVLFSGKAQSTRMPRTGWVFQWALLAL